MTDLKKHEKKIFEHRLLIRFFLLNHICESLRALPSVEEIKRLEKKTSVSKAYSRIILPGSFFPFHRTECCKFYPASFDDLLYNKQCQTRQILVKILNCWYNVTFRLGPEVHQ